MTKFKNIWKSLANTDFAGPRVFSMIRNNDESGISGTGRVLDGVIFPNGKVVICWNTQDNPESKVDVGSVSVFDCFKDFRDIHIGSHPSNKTEIKWLN